MKEVIKIFRQLQNTSGKKDKEKIIAANQDNKLFKKCLVFLLDDNVVTGIAKKSIKKNIACNNYIMVLDSWEQCMDYFQENNTGKDYDILIAQAFVKSQDEEDREFYEQMITKSLKLGCDKKTVNKVIPNLIFEWKVQLGSPYDKLKLKKGERFFLSQKLNGIRCSYMDGKLMSRQGKEFSGLDHIIEDIKSLNLEDFFIDGELIRRNVDEIDDNENFRLTASIVNSDAITKPEIQLVIFDMFHVDTIADDKTTEKYNVRKLRMQDMKKILDQNHITSMDVVEMLYEGTDESEIMNCLEMAEQNNWEGIMLNKNTPYEFKRTTNLIKIKKFHTCDLRVTGYVEGQGKYKGVLGSLVVDYKGNRLEIGSGFSDAERKTFWENREEMIGQIMQVKYKDVSKNAKTGLESLQFATYECIRTDKTEPSYN